MSATTRTLLQLLLTVGVAHADPAEITLKGKDELKLKADGPNWKLKGPGDQSRQLSPEGDGKTWRLSETKKVLLRATCGPDRAVHVTDSAGAVVHDLVRTGEGFEIFGPGKLLAFRVKLKADKVNVYDGKAQRIAHGKAKEDGFAIRDASDAELWKVKGVSSLAELAYFAVPLEMGELALFWRACP